MQIIKLKNILEAVLLGADRPLTVIQMEALFELDEERPTRDEIRKALHEMDEDYESRGYELKQVASGFRLQVKQEYATWVGRLWEERPARYTRALLETMSLIAYRQPITRGEIEEVRGVSVSSNIIKTLLERDWIKVLGHKDVPGRPSLYGTTKEFLDYFNLKSLDQLPTLAEIKDLDSINPELALDGVHDSNEQASTDESEDEKNNDVQSSDDQSSDDQSNDKSSSAETVQDVIVAELITSEQVDAEQVASEQETADSVQPESAHVDINIENSQLSDPLLINQQSQDQHDSNQASEEVQGDETDALIEEEKKQAFNV